MSTHGEHPWDTDPRRPDWAADLIMWLSAEDRVVPYLEIKAQLMKQGVPDMRTLHLVLGLKDQGWLQESINENQESNGYTVATI